MPITIDYYATLISPWAYLGHSRLCKLAEAYGATLNFKPADYGAIFNATGGLPLAKRPPARQQYRLQELKRWRDDLGIPLNLHPEFFPVPHDTASRMCLAAADETTGDDLRLAGAFLAAVWTHDQDISNTETLVQIANRHGLNGLELLAKAAQPKFVEKYKANTDEAIAAGVFGAPSYVIGDDIFWGQDRLSFVEQILKAEA